MNVDCSLVPFQWNMTSHVYIRILTRATVKDLNINIREMIPLELDVPVAWVHPNINIETQIPLELIGTKIPLELYYMYL